MTGNTTMPTDVTVASCLGAGFEDQEALLGRLGRHKTGKACLYVRKLAEIDLAVLDELIKGSVAATLARYGST